MRLHAIVFPVLLQIVLLTVGGWQVWAYQEQTVVGEGFPVHADAPRPPATQHHWGVTLNFNPIIGSDTEQVADGIMRDVRDLGVNTVRVGVPAWADNPRDLVAPLLLRLKQAGIQVVIGFDASVPWEEFPGPEAAYQMGWRDGFWVATMFPEADYFQLANEPAGLALKPSWPGVTFASFEPDKYARFAAWLHGAADGLREVNPTAQRIITGHWLHFGYFDQLIADGVPFEIIGWDLPGEARDLTRIENADSIYNLFDELAKRGKEVWISEFGLSGGSYQGEEAQAAYLETMTEHILASGRVSGIFAFVLHDEAHKAYLPQEGRVGLVGIAAGPAGWEFGQRKRAYYTFQQLINNDVR